MIDETTGKITGYKTTVGGADTVFPFSEIDRLELIHALANSGLGLTENSTPEEIYAALATKFPPTKSWIIPGWYTSGNNASSSIHSGNDYVQMVISASGYYGSVTTYMTSPTIDVTTFKTLKIEGQSRRSTGNPTEGYQPELYLINASTGGSTLLFKGTSGGSAPVIDTINVSRNIASLTGNYYLKGKIGNYEDGQNNGAYIYLAKALLSA